MADKSPRGLFIERKCKECEKIIVTLNPKGYVYKIPRGSGMDWYCGWACFRKGCNKYGKNKNKRKSIV